MTAAFNYQVMQKKRVKALRMLANRLPDSLELIKVPEEVLGKDVPKHLILKSKMKVFAEKTYKLLKPEYKEIGRDQHVRRLKKVYNDNGEKGIINYIQELETRNRRFNRMHSEFKLMQVDKEIMNIIKKGVGSFWKNLFMFFFAFAKIFQNDRQDKDLEKV